MRNMPGMPYALFDISITNCCDNDCEIVLVGKFDDYHEAQARAVDAWHVGQMLTCYDSDFNEVQFGAIQILEQQKAKAAAARWDAMVMNARQRDAELVKRELGDAFDAAAQAFGEHGPIEALKELPAERGPLYYQTAE